MASQYEIEEIITEITKNVDPLIKHNDTVSQIKGIFRRYGFYTTREYPIYRIKDRSGRAGRIDLVARKGKFRVAIEYDHKYHVKYKSFQKIIQIKPDAAVGIVGKGELNSNIERAMPYMKGIQIPLYIISLKERRYKLLKG
ncbi:MAG: hypothetical protein LVQ95_00030 [Candidatus Micrarchaeales archaeon]|nr:hypothetical protein [Candidatus Micrarchaeales archaeon]